MTEKQNQGTQEAPDKIHLREPRHAKTNRKMRHAKRMS